jgi:hypothetical protein
MTTAFRMALRRCRLNTSLLASVICLATSACALTNSKVVEEVLVESPRGTVFLQNAEDDWFATAHPLSLSPTFLASVLRGVHVQAASTGIDEGDPVFSDDETEFLSALMSTALTKAAKRQVVGFRVHHETDAGGTTDGILYVQGRLLHLTFTHYRAQRAGLSRDKGFDLVVPNPTGLDRGQLRFVPESARRSSRHEQPDVTKTPPLFSLVIDYEALPSWSVPSTGNAKATQEIPVAPAGEIGTAQEVGKKKETDLETLKEDVRVLQRRLSELNVQLQNSKKP